jgi:hypothetical protein
MEPGAPSLGSLLRLDPKVFRSSQFWILTGLLSVGVAISSMSKRFTNMVRFGSRRGSAALARRHLYGAQLLRAPPCRRS